MNLRPRFFLINTLILLFGFMFTIFIFFKIADKTVERWGLALAEKQLLYDKTRAVQYLTKEITLSRQLSKSRQVIDWARNQYDIKSTSEGQAEMENFRSQFDEGNYFIAFENTGRYHYKNKESKQGEDIYKYTLNPNNPDDHWFYSIVDEGKEFHINVNPDYYLNVTKLWIDVVIKENDKVLGVLGTGLDIDDFISNFASGVDKGMTSLFMDHNGAVQIYFDKSKIDYASITKKKDEHNYISNMFDDDGDRAFIRQSMEKLANDKKDAVYSRFLKIDGKKKLACISYIPELDWYEVTFYDVNSLISTSDLSGVIIAFALTLLFSIAIYTLALDKFVIHPVRQLDMAISDMRKGNYKSLNSLKHESGELGRLTSHFNDMAQSVKETTENLENKVRERTEELNKLVRIDPMTELFNRRGMNEIIELEIKRAERTYSRIGMLWIDIDLFKEINDTYGHGLGDETIIRTAQVIKHAVRQYDYVSRWGGDEFIVLLTECNPDTLHIGSNRIKEALNREFIKDPKSGDMFNIKVSIGGYMANSGDSQDTLLNKADKALYQAKENGRNCIAIIS